MMTASVAVALVTATASAAADAGAPPPAEAPATQLFLGAFPVDSRISRSLFAPGAVEVTLHFDAAGAGGTNELVRRTKAAIAGDGRMVLGSIAYPVATDRPGRQHTRPSFLIDFDEPVFKPVLADARTELGPAPNIDAVVAFVERFITKKGMERGYDIASVVAKRREGDCTEHAVLLAAIARAFRLPARVVSGIVLTEVDGKPRVFGHAWTEIHRAGRWQRADAAFTRPERLVYVPLELVSDEGPGFALSLMKATSGTLGVRRVSIADGEKNADNLRAEPSKGSAPPAMSSDRRSRSPHDASTRPPSAPPPPANR